MWQLATGIGGIAVVARPPAPAAAVGYNLQTFGPAMTFAANPTLPLGGANWAPFNFFGVAWNGSSSFPPIVVTQNSNGSLTMVTGNMGDNFGAQLCTAVYDPTQPDYMRGHAFGGGAFFEATLSFTGAPSATGVSFWSNDIEHMAGSSAGDLTLSQWPGQVAGYGDWIELDFPEFDVGNATQYGQGIHNWYSNVAGTDVNTGFYPGFVSPITVPVGTDFSQPHKYGFLWVPATGSLPPPTNVFGNTSLTGAVPGSPGTLPTGVDATSQAQGLLFQVIAGGTDGTTGNAFFDLRMHGTGAGTGDCNIYLSGLNGTATLPSTNYTLQVGLAIVGGSTANLTGIFIASNDLDSGHNFVQGATFQNVSLTGTVQTFAPGLVTTAATAFNTFSIGLGNPASGQPVDITVRIEVPQVLQSATQGPPQGYAKWFFDDVQVGTTVFWNKYNSALAPPPAQGTTAYSVMDTRHFALNLGLGDTANPVTIYSVSVWQTTAANNIINPPVPPAQAAAAGYNTLHFFDDFNASSTIAPTRAGTGFNWWPGPNGTPTYTVTNSELQMSSDPSPNSGALQSILNAGASPGPNVFRHVYFEAKMKFVPTGFGGTGGWPAFWSLSSNWPNESTFEEVDFMEGIPTPRTAGSPAELYQTVHEWTANFGSESKNNEGGGANIPAIPAGTDFSIYHKYGCLWTPNQLTWYFDDAPYVTVNISAGSGYSLESSGDSLYMILGTGLNWLCTWDWVKVWGA